MVARRTPTANWSLVRESVRAAEVFYQLTAMAAMKSQEDRHVFDPQMRDLQEHVADLQARIDKMSPTFEVEDKPR